MIALGHFIIVEDLSRWKTSDGFTSRMVVVVRGLKMGRIKCAYILLVLFKIGSVTFILYPNDDNQIFLVTVDHILRACF